MMATNDSEPTVFLQKFIVADVTTGVILGSGFLSKNNMVVSFADRALRYKNNLFPFSCVSDRFRVVLSHDVCFSKNQKEIIACGRFVSSDTFSADNYVFSPSSELVRDVGNLLAYSIVDTSNYGKYASCSIAPSTAFSSPKKGRTIGYVEAVDATQLAAIHPTPNQSTAPTSTPESAGNGPVIDLSHIGDTERQQLQELMDEFSDVFSTGEGDVGRT